MSNRQGPPRSHKAVGRSIRKRGNAYFFALNIVSLKNKWLTRKP
jgi:hypothetical protein